MRKALQILYRFKTSCYCLHNLGKDVIYEQFQQQMVHSSWLIDFVVTIINRRGFQSINQ